MYCSRPRMSGVREATSIDPELTEQSGANHGSLLPDLDVPVTPTP
jgi:hypothetical protein